MEEQGDLVTVITQINRLHNQNPQYNGIKYTFKSSGCRHSSHLLEPAVFCIAIYLGLQVDCQFPYFVMITASHNPPSDNGVKVFCPQPFSLCTGFFHQVESILNNSQMFNNYVQQKVMQLHSDKRQDKLRCVYVGRDCRLSSPSLQRIFVQTLQLVGVRSVQIGVCSTPQFLALSQCIWHNSLTTKKIPTAANIQQVHENHVNKIIHEFETIFSRLYSHPQKLKLYIDFANGSGAISFNPYCKKLSKYVNLTLDNTSDFANPNAHCGAEYIYKHWKTAVNDNKYNGYDFCVFFDGDSDRIIVRVAGSEELFDGDCFLLLYRQALLRVLIELPEQVKCILDGIFGKFQIGVFGNINTNLGVKQHLMKQNNSLHISQVGFRSLYRAATDNQILSIMFEPNGHGGIYMCKQLTDTLKDLHNQYPTCFQLQLLVGIHHLMQNNAAGYALHNLLLMLIFSQYLYGDDYARQMSNSYQKYHVSSKELQIKMEYCEKFSNSTEKLCELLHPVEVVNGKKSLQLMYPDYDVKIRKSATTNNMVRTHIQGKSIEICAQIQNKLLSLMKHYIQ